MMCMMLYQLEILPHQKVESVLSLLPGEECEASFGNKLYPARVIAIGK